MRFDLAQLARRVRNTRRRAITIRDIAPPAMLATDLYRAAYAPVVQIWDRAAADIVAEYARTADVNASARIAVPLASAGHTDSNPARARFSDSASDIQARIDAASSEFDRLFLTLQAALEDWALRTERWHRSAWTRAVLAGTGVDLTALIGPEDTRETLDQYLRWNADLIRDVSAQARQRISSAVFSGLQNRAPAREVAKQIREAVGMSKRRSVGIASDQLSKVSSALADERRRQAGLSVWKWRHSGKRHPREEHRARDGRLYSDDAAGVGQVVDGVTVHAAPAEGDRPGRPLWCGCRAQSVMVFD